MTGPPGTTRPTHTMQTTDNSLTWLLESLLERTPAPGTPWSSPVTG